MFKKFILNNKFSIVLVILAVFALFYLLTMGLNKKCHVIDLSNQKHSAEVQAVNLSKTFINAVRAHQYKKVTSLFGFGDSNTDHNRLFYWVNSKSDLFPNTKEKSIKLIEIKHLGKNTKSEVAPIGAALVYQFDDRFMLVTCASVYMQGEPGKILGCRIKYTFGDFEKINEFNNVSLKNLTIKRFLALALWFAMPLLTLIALITCIKTTFPKSKFKWLWKSLWIIFICVGLGCFAFNWAAQTYEFKLLTYRLFSFDLQKTHCFLPVYIAFNIPLGAIIYLLKHFLCDKQKANITKTN
jgi:hypothetical protein